MLLELAIMGLVGYGLIKNPEKTNEMLGKANEKIGQQMERMDQKVERQYRRGEISDGQYQDYWNKRNGY